MSASPEAPRCSLVSQDLAESLAGTAAQTRSWLLVEQPVRWQREAAHSSHPDAMSRLMSRAAQLDVRVQLLRRPMATSARGWRPRVVLATTDAGGGRAAQADVAPGELDALAHDGTLDALATGTLPTGWDTVDRMWAVCTHGRRDACCALHGRRLVAALSAREPGRVWETTHLGGHRFAPTVLVLPEGLVYGRVPLERVHELVTAQRAGQVVPDLLRGRTALPPAGQVAEVALREHLGARSGRDIVLADDDTRAAVGPTGVARTASRWHVGSGTWRVVVDTSAAAPRPVSCGAEATSPAEHTVVEVTDVDAAGHGVDGWDARHAKAAAPDPDDADVRVLDALAGSAPGQALDLACGTGRHTLALARSGWSVTAVDFSRTGLDALQAAATDRDAQVTTVLADVRHWDPGASTYDLILLAFVHVPGVVERVARWLRPGGLLVVLGHAVRNFTDGVGGPSDVRLLHDPRALRTAAESAGLSVSLSEEQTRPRPGGIAVDAVLVARSPQHAPQD